MKNKRFTAKMLIDIGMTICLLLLMPYSLLSETAHEWIGMAMLVLFISHYILNHKWVTSVRKGKYNAFRVIQTVLVIIMLILIMGSMITITLKRASTSDRINIKKSSGDLAQTSHRRPLAFSIETLHQL